MKSTLFYYSLKGNTVGILSELREEEFTHIIDLGYEGITKSLVRDLIKESTIIVLAVPTYYPSYQEKPDFPKFLRKYEKELLQIRDKHVIVVGSGRSEYKHFCGSVDFFRQHYVKANYVKTFKFEGYPRAKEISQFTRLYREEVKEVTNGKGTQSLNVRD
ncbi:flavodoxin [Bacillus phage Nigalana]|uniref:Flavodoxin n=5 Tax=Wphvirus TaxID=1922327 RepID=A0A024B289_9CAUD|nr:flavodoxin [Bacillus phage Megatron]YP_009212082.1 flavodoxin [Bacillus phage Eyuki]YP_009279309.1 flavodoxin [Bacillus phage Kida]YP_009280944.1 flavodoxin [Bacillus phage SageFayge]YP_009282535.1 flavodoxin [Bacillus phage Nigalana]YP_009284467.1 flavodoxin [Bacillus phage NotTheCreek]YP_009285086.1 flavodoxin [Bacillus phage DirtyBetty]YP_009287019.1 flavodoxin [Bacillus phage Nemo]ASR78379.1 flavodoxin [Bacillus phage PPIsBest]ASR78601.1 flavodoxin [Bacillus phage Bubs]ASR79375.1 f